jgi:serine/threonine protein kinase
MAKVSDWEEIRPLGKGGQSVVTLVRRPERRIAREESFKILHQYSAMNLERKHAEAFARAAYDIARTEDPHELGALKTFTPRLEGPDPEGSSVRRLHNEIEVLQKKREGFLQLLDSNEEERWIVTEYCQNGTLDSHLNKYRGNVLVSLQAIIPLIETVAELHRSDSPIVHRDIKPQNIFVGPGGELLLGDFGLVFLPDAPDRPTFTGETVGPRDFMPPWVLGVDRPGITTAFDVYMLGKVLWCMVSGRQKLYREDFAERHLDLTKMFPKDPDMHVINQILRKCVVRYEEDCLPHAGELLLWVQRTAEKLQAGGHIIREGVPRRCRVCGEGEYLPEFREKGKDDPSASLTFSRVFNGLAEGAGKITLQAYACDKCGHVQFFKPPTLSTSLR